MPALDIETAKEHLRVDGPAEDADISIKLAAAEQAVESYIGPLLSSAQTLKLERFQCGPILLPAHKVTAVNAVKYQPLTGAEVTLTEGVGYYVDFGSVEGSQPRIMPGLNGWPYATLRPGAAVTVEYTAGYADEESIPAWAKQAVLLELGSFYRNREAIITEGSAPRELDRGVRHLIAPYIVYRRGFIA